MEPHQQQNQNSHLEDMMNGGNECAKTSTSSYLCRQSSARWTPTTEQIKLLKELYYIDGLRSPTADQIHAICAQLRRYGKVEGKNVFYWFQNHKARERQRKRLIPNSTPNPTHYHNNTIIRKWGLHWKQDQDLIEQNKCPSINNSGVPHYSSSAGVVSGGVQLVGSVGHDAVTMENKVRGISILGGGVLNGGDVKQNLEWSGGNYNLHARPTSYSNFLDKMSANADHQQDHDEAPKTETLPLFPMHSEEHHDHDHDHEYNHHLVPTMKTGSDGYYTSGYWWAHGSGGSASLELSLKSGGYGCYPPNL